MKSNKAHIIFIILVIIASSLLIVEYYNVGQWLVMDYMGDWFIYDFFKYGESLARFNYPYNYNFIIVLNFIIPIYQISTAIYFVIAKKHLKTNRFIYYLGTGYTIVLFITILIFWGGVSWDNGMRQIHY